jgi:hypothetical protein
MSEILNKDGGCHWNVVADLGVLWWYVVLTDK